MLKKCLFCYKELYSEDDFHSACSLKFFGTNVAPKLNYTIDEMEELAQNIVESSIAVPGVQPKLSLGFINDVLQNGNKGRLTVVGALGGNYILKPQNKTFPEMPENEHLTMKMAEIFGISTVPSSLIRLKSGELSYITKRIDRKENGEKIHMQDMFQITEAFDKYRSSLEKIGKAITEYSSNTLLDILRFYEVILFSYITGNNDMHLKNFSLIRNNENWEFSPAYDLLNVHLHLPEDKEETALTLAGKKSRLNKKDFIQLGLKFNLTEKQISNSFKRLKKGEKKMLTLIEKSFLTLENQEMYNVMISSRLDIFK